MKIKVLLFLLFGYTSCMSAVVIGDETEATCLDVTSTGSFIIAGSAVTENGEEIFVAQYAGGGVLDDSFAGNGVVTTASGTRAGANDVVVDGSDRPVVVGHSDTSWLIARYTTAGVLDVTFGTAGITTTIIGDGADAKSVALDGDGEFIVGGGSVSSGNPASTLARYTSAGVLDTAGFNSGGAQPGVVTMTINDRSSVNAVATSGTGAGRLYYTGGFAVTSSTGISQFSVLKLDSTGALVGAFGASGSATTTIGTVARINDIAIDGSARIVAVGVSDRHIALARYDGTTGALDTAGFNSGGSQPGVVTTNIGNSSAALRVAIQSDGKIVVAGFSDGRYIIVRYNTDGSIDEEDFVGGSLNQLVFGNGGIVTVQIDTLVSANGLLIRSADQNIVVAGGASGSTFLAIHNTQGQPVTSFGREGIVLDIQGENAVAAGVGGLGGNAITQTGQLNTIDYNIKTLGFNGSRRLEAGDRGPKITQSLRSLGEAVTVTTNAPTTNDLMIFDQGVSIDNVLIISADNNSSAPTMNGVGGEFIFDFDNPIKIISLTFLNVSAISTIETYDDVAETTLLSSVSVPISAVAQTVAINSSNVKRVKITTTGTMKIDTASYQEGTSFDVKGQTSFIYDTTAQSVVVAAIYQTITFDTLVQLQGWTYSAGTLTCTQTGRYAVHYTSTFFRSGAGYGSIRSLYNGTEFAGSEVTITLIKNTYLNIVSEFQLDVSAGDTLLFQFTGNNTNVTLSPYQPVAGVPTTPVSIVGTITRVS